MSIQGVSHEELIAKIRALKDNREFSPCTIIAKAPTIFRPILDELRNLIAYRNYANWLLSTDYPKPPTFPLIRSHQGGIPHLEFIDTERMKMFLTKASPDTTTSPFVAEVLHDFFARHPECLSYFAMVGCPNLFLGYLSEDHLNRAERFFVTCIRKYGVSDPMVKLLVVNFLCHAFDFLGALRSRFSEKAPMLDDQSPFNMSEWLIDCFVSSLPCLSAPYLAVLREAIHNSDATFAIVWQDFLPRIVDDWMSYDRLSDHLRGSPPDEPTRNALLRAVDDLKQSAQPLDIDGLVYGRPRPKYLCSLLDAHVIDSHRSATGSPTILRQLIGPLDVQTLGLDFFEFEVGLAKEALPYAVSDSLSRLKGRGDLLDILAAERPDLLPEYLAELEATALCIDRMRKRFHTPRILASIRAEAEMSALAAFRRYARVSPLGRAQMETAYSDFVHAKIADLLRWRVDCRRVPGESVREVYARHYAARYPGRTPAEDAHRMVAAIIQSHSAAVRRWVQAHAVEWLNGQTLCGIPDAIDIRLDEAAIGAIRTWKERMPDGGATAVSRWVAAYQFDERWAGNDLVEFALIGEAMFALLETFSDEIKRLSEVADDPDAVRRTRGIVHGLFLPDALARQKVAMGAARAAAALRDVHRWLPRDMVVAIWEFCLWFGGTPAPCPFP